MTTIASINIFDNIPETLSEELVEVLSKSDNFRIERIVSKGHASPDDFFYTQEDDEFVLLLKGSAGLIFEDRTDEVVLKAGDYLQIPANVKHRIKWTAENENTVWLAIHY